jgi:oligoendopeptidase F
LFDDTMAALRFDFEGESLTLEPLLGKLMDPDAKIRERAANALAATLGANLRLFTLITNTLAKDKETSDRWRKFKDVADSRHLANRVEPEVVEALVTAVTDGYPRLTHRYYTLKARWFDKAQLDHWDRNAPLPNAPRRVYKWETARDMVLGAYSAFSPRMGDIARRFFDEGWIDAPVRPGKAPGAFAHPTTPSSHPYILVNFLGKPRDVTTLAHELGHGVHQVLAGVNGPLMAPTPLTLAETASVFGEMLTFRSMLTTNTDLTERKAMLAAKVEDMLNTVARQIAFYKFERLIHLERRNGELTTELISQFWMNTQSESLGPAIALRPGYETYWAYIGHFIHSPFYVYAYAFGDCLVNSLYGVYERSSEGFAERYLAMLAAGGSKSYSELLAPFGLDAKDPGFWKIGLSVIERMIDELETMA